MKVPMSLHPCQHLRLLFLEGNPPAWVRGKLEVVLDGISLMSNNVGHFLNVISHLPFFC